MRIEVSREEVLLVTREAACKGRPRFFREVGPVYPAQRSMSSSTIDLQRMVQFTYIGKPGSATLAVQDRKDVTPLALVRRAASALRLENRNCAVITEPAGGWLFRRPRYFSSPLADDD